MKLRQSAAALLVLLATTVVFGACDGNRSVGLTNESAPPTIRVPIQAIVVGDDDGARRARVDADRLVEAVAFARRTFAPAGIDFEFVPDRDVVRIEGTLLNDLSTPPVPNWAQVKPVGDRVAAGYPGKIVVLLRHGPDDRPVGNGFAGTDHAFIVMPGTEDSTHCGHVHTDALAHEIGHYLGLSHTFVGKPFPDLAAAEAHVVERGSDPGVFDGDRLSDTPPDPGVRELECRRVAEITLAGMRFRLPRRNIMSYYDERDSLSPQQALRARWMLEQRLAWPHMMRPVNRTGAGALEIESLEVRRAHAAAASVQSMDGFGVGDWSGGAQLFVGAQDGGELTLRLSVAARIEQPVLYATRAPDSGRIHVMVGGESVGRPIDLYAPIVLPSGPVPLGPRAILPGEHDLTIRVVGKNPASTGYAFGIDAIGAADTPPLSP